MPNNGHERDPGLSAPARPCALAQVLALERAAARDPFLVVEKAEAELGAGRPLLAAARGVAECALPTRENACQIAYTPQSLLHTSPNSAAVNVLAK